jgi:hypothetical protein
VFARALTLACVCVCVREREEFYLTMLLGTESMYFRWQENKICVWNTDGMILTRENRSIVRKASPSASLPTTDPTWTGL